MPRASSKKPAQKTRRQKSSDKPALPEWKRMNLAARLEAQLSKVVDLGPGIVASEAKQSGRSKDSNEIASSSVTPRNDKAQILSSTRHLDTRLVEHVVAKAGSGRRRLSVRVGEHTTSPYVVPVSGLARKIRVESREPILETVEEWNAPYEEPPSIEDMAALASALYLHRVEPALWLEQFTPGDAEVAYGERFGWWSRLRAPLVRWEPAVGESGGGREEAIAEPKRVMPDAVHLDASPESVGSRLRRRVIEAFAKAKDREDALIAEIEEEWGVPVLVPKIAPARVMVGFFALLLLVSLPAGAVSLSRSVGASWAEVGRHGRSAADATVAALAGAATDSAAWGRVSKSLNETDRALNRVNALAVAVTQALPDTRDAYASARRLLAAGDASAQAAELLAQGLDRAFAEPARYPVDRGRVFKTYLDAAVPLLDEANEALAGVRPDALPEAERAKAAEAARLLGTVREAVRELRAITDLLMAAAGDEHRRSYLLIFQNPTELRPTGGFMGSIALLTLDRGEIKSLEVPGGGPYDLKGELKERVRPPDPLRLVASRWEFQDANWFPDFPTAAEKIRWFWSKSGQPSIDGVVAVNLRLLERLLEVTGSVELPAYGKTITAENVWIEMQKAVELEYDREENKPKKIVGDLMAELLGRLKTAGRDDWMKLIALGTESLESKDMQIWLVRDEEEAMVERFGWNGSFKETPGDSLAVIGANIAGQKSDRMIRETVEHLAEIQPDGSIMDTVRITRTHTGTKGDLFSGVNNVTYLRVYVPEGSELLSAEGFSPPPADLFKHPLDTDDVDADLEAVESKPRVLPGGVKATDEFGRTAFGGWVQLEPGETRVTEFRYRLPFTAQDLARRLRPGGAPKPDAIRPAYTALYTSQSGKPERELKARVRYPSEWEPVWTHASGLAFEATWDRDLVAAGMFDALVQ
ncbi:DUF4012 domain-containing protein [Candidatus Uhrbacteria bacterium]|nr:MAG: DUF4012 domain-containing protein [Candidatus Uhrbacteria bacterium]